MQNTIINGDVIDDKKKDIELDEKYREAAYDAILRLIITNHFLGYSLYYGPGSVKDDTAWTKKRTL